ncbi:MAG: type VI secretion system tube protein Hcp [Gemmatimonadota bacterium]|nr:type VI secretion system tube protein Hcp [Gemmatimonadota bacterium]
MEKMPAKGALSVTADLKGGKIAFNATDIAYEVASPRDVASGMASGKRQHKPVTLTAELGDWSVKLYQAHETNEVIKTVAIELGAGHTLTLDNTSISSMRLGTDASGKVVQEVSFVARDVKMK